MNFEHQTRRPRRLGRVLLWLVLLPLGGYAGFWYHQIAQPVYVSEGSFRIIEDGSGEEGFSIRHDRLIMQEGLVDRCFSKTGLKNLPSFNNVSGDEIIPHVVDHLQVKPDTAEPSVYHISYQSSKPDDARTIVNNLLIAYFNELKLRAADGDPSRAWRSELQDQLDRAQITDEPFRNWIVEYIERLRPAVQTQILSDASAGKLVSHGMVARILSGIGIAFVIGLVLIAIGRMLR